MTPVVSVKTIAVGLCAGLASAILVISPVGGTALAVPLTLVIGLPLVIASLGWGAPAAIIAVLAGVGALAAASPLLALDFAVFFAPPAVIGSHMLGLSRRIVADMSQPAPAGSAVEWYPLGRIAVLVAGAVVAGAVVMAIAHGFNPSDLTPEQIDRLTEAYATAVEAVGDQGTRPTKEDLQPALRELVPAMMSALPFVFCAVWTVVALANLYLGAWITAQSSRLARPWEDVAAFEPPRWVFGLFLAAAATTAMEGTAGSIAAALAGALAVVLILVGLAVVHTITRGWPVRVGLLAAIYVFVGLFALPLLLLGIAELFLRLRMRARRRALARRGPD